MATREEATAYGLAFVVVDAGGATVRGEHETAAVVVRVVRPPERPPIEYEEPEAVDVGVREPEAKVEPAPEPEKPKPVRTSAVVTERDGVGLWRELRAAGYYIPHSEGARLWDRGWRTVADVERIWMHEHGRIE